ncbi:MAG: glutamate formimidoyltransferase [Candidatus Eisenbacteria bacterium]|nr:glutamate formimidoyltransferase [Candidatus Eisenbacteria bacterium]
MARLVECVPNFSEGKDAGVVEAIVKEICSVDGVKLLDKEMNADHNRAVISFIGEPEAVVEAAFKGAKKAHELIDLNKHEGEHPRMGATDVIPIVPLMNVTMSECVELAKRLGRRIGEELAIPVFLYEAAATRPDRENLAQVRSGEFEGLREAIGRDACRKPDFGPEQIHPTAGAVAVGARMPLVAFNVNLGTSNISIARNIAKAIRFADGGLRYVKALGFELKEIGLVQVSMNLVNTKGTPIHRVFALIKSEAERYGVPILGSEIVGLIPMDALIDVAEHHLRLEGFERDQILETRLLGATGSAESTLAQYVEEVAAPSAVPGGGSVSALAGALSSALSAMVCGLTVGKKRYADVWEEMKQLGTVCETSRKKLMKLAEADSRAFEQVLKSRRALKVRPEETARREALRVATMKAIDVPLEVCRESVKILEYSKIAAEKGNVNSVSDAGVSACMAHSALVGASLNVFINLGSVEDKSTRSSIRHETEALRESGEKLFREVSGLVESRVLSDLG